MVGSDVEVEGFSRGGCRCLQRWTGVAFRTKIKKYQTFIL